MKLSKKEKRLVVGLLQEKQWDCEGKLSEAQVKAYETESLYWVDKEIFLQEKVDTIIEIVKKLLEEI